MHISANRPSRPQFGNTTAVVNARTYGGSTIPLTVKLASDQFQQLRQDNTQLTAAVQELTQQLKNRVV